MYVCTSESVGMYVVWMYLWVGGYVCMYVEYMTRHYYLP